VSGLRTGASLFGRVRGRDGRGRKLRGLLELLRPYRGRVVLLLICLPIATAAALAPPYLLGRAIDDGIRGGSTRALSIIVILFVASALIAWVATYAQTYLVNWVGQRALQDLRSRIFAHLQRLSIGFYSRNRAGVLISRITNDVQALDQLVTDGVQTLFSSTLTLLGTAIILLFLDAELALVTFLVFPLLLGGSIVFRIVSTEAYRLTREKVAWVTAYLQETISGVRVVRAFGQEARHKERFAELNDDNRQANMRTVNLNAAYFPSVELLSAVATAAILLYGGAQVLSGDAVTIGVLASFVFYLNSFFDPIQQLSQLYTTYQSGMAALDKIFELLDEEPEVAALPGATELPRVRGEIAFEDVSFAYAGEEGALALADVDLRIPPGQTVALVGATGAGKSTLAKLVARFYDPTHGRVLVDGHDLREVTERSLRSQLGLVPQEGFLFSGTVRENIAFGRPGRERRRGRDRRRRGRRRWLHRGSARGLRDGGGRARREPLDRPAPTRGLRARGRGRSAHPHPRRGDRQRRRPHRGAHRARPEATAGGAHGDRHRPPSVDHPPRRAHPGARRGTGGRGRGARGADRGGWGICTVVPGLGRAGGGVRAAGAIPSG